MTPDAAVPLEVGRAGDADLLVRWNDGHVSVYPARYLRLACPCASCHEKLRERNLFAGAHVPPDVKPLGVSLVGRYALSVRWSDGHDTGIYSFPHLRDLCPCEDCAPVLRP